MISIMRRGTGVNPSNSTKGANTEREATGWLARVIFLLVTGAIISGCGGGGSPSCSITEQISPTVAQGTPNKVSFNALAFYSDIYLAASRAMPTANPLRSPLQMTLSPADKAYILAVDAYVWGLPVEQFWEKQGIFTNNSNSAPINKFYLANAIDTSTTIVSPNTSVLYAQAFLDLSQHPYIVSHPVSSTYNVLQVMDAYTNVQTSVGTRINACGNVVLYWANASYAGQVKQDYPNAIAIYSPQAWLIGRVAVDTYAVQNQGGVAQTLYQMVRGAATSMLALWQSQNVLKQYTLSPLTNYSNSASVLQSPVVSAALDFNDFYTYLGQAVAKNGLLVNYSGVQNGILNATSAVYDQSDMYGYFAPIGLTPSGFTLPADSNVVSQISAGYLAAKNVVNTIGSLGGATSANNYWGINTSLGQYPVSYQGWLEGAAVAAVGLGANLAADGTYPQASVDISGDVLNGANSYQLDFTGTGAPPVKPGLGFWSVTVYDKNKNIYTSNTNSYYYTSQVGGVYSLGSIQFENTQPVLYLQNAAPTDPAKLPFWIPVPQTDFSVVMRLYNPVEANAAGKMSILNPYQPAASGQNSPQWIPPGITKQ
jgi:hypothetical protein